MSDNPSENDSEQHDTPVGSEDGENGSERGGEQEDGQKDRVEKIIDRHFEKLREERKQAAEVHRQRREAREENASGPEGFSWKHVDVEAYLANEHERKEKEWGTDYPGVEIGQYHGKKPTSSEFLRHTQGDLASPLFVNTDRFLKLPYRVVESVIALRGGRLTYGDTVNIELPILSYLAGLSASQPDGSQRLEYDHGDTITIPEGQIVVSQQKVTRAIAERYYFYPTPRGSTTADSNFHRIYRSAVNAIDRLCNTGLLEHQGPAIDTGNATSDAYGQRFVVTINDHRCLPQCSATPSVTFGNTDQGSPAGSYDEKFGTDYRSTLDDGSCVVDVAGMFDRLVCDHTSQWDTFTEQAAKSTTASRDPAGNFRTPERSVQGFSWQRRQARPSTVDPGGGQENSRHVITGAYKPGCATHAERAHLPCTVPFLVLEIDGETPQLCLQFARRIAEWLESLGVPLESVAVTYTGNQSFHIRLPAGLFGKPIFRSTRVATKTVRELYSIIEDRVDQLDGAYIDRALASPLHHIRAVGSVHEGLYSKKEKTRYCVGFTAEEILRYPLGAIREFSARYDGYTLPRPGEVDVHQQLRDLLAEAHERAQATGETDDGSFSSAGIFEKIYREGVEKGEEFAERLVGRNMAARIVSLNLLQSGCSPQNAWIALQEWNERNEPSLGDAPEDSTGELRYVFERARDEEARL